MTARALESGASPHRIFSDSLSGTRQYVGIQFFNKIGPEYPVYWFKSKIPMTLQKGDIVLAPDRNNRPTEVLVVESYQLSEWKLMPKYLYIRQRGILQKQLICFVRKWNTPPKKGYRKSLPKL